MANVVNDTPSAVVSLEATVINQLVADITALQASYNIHVHSGITAGGANSAVPTVLAGALTSATITVNK